MRMPFQCQLHFVATNNVSKQLLPKGQWARQKVPADDVTRAKVPCFTDLCRVSASVLIFKVTYMPK